MLTFYLWSKTQLSIIGHLQYFSNRRFRPRYCRHLKLNSTNKGSGPKASCTWKVHLSAFRSPDTRRENHFSNAAAHVNTMQQPFSNNDFVSKIMFSAIPGHSESMQNFPKAKNTLTFLTNEIHLYTYFKKCVDMYF